MGRILTWRPNRANIESTVDFMFEDAMIKTNDIHSLTDFQRNTRDHVVRHRETGRPAVLTVNGKAELVVQDAAAYQDLLERLERAETIAGIQRGQLSASRGAGIPADEALKTLRDELGLRSKAK
jgi:hypothetical protein